MTEQASASPNLWLEQAEVTAGRLNRLAEALGARSYLGDTFKVVFAIHDFHPGRD
jgi:hypothetical protein